MISDSKIIDDVIENIEVNSKNIKNKKEILLNIFYGINCGDCSDISILILNAPCNGFGDIIFAMKIANYLREWYNVKITIATTNTNSFITLGENPNNLVKLISKSDKNKTNIQCIIFKNLIFEKKINEHDLIFVAPVPSEKDNNYYDVQQLINYSNKFNTYFFSEYNYGPNFDFPTGIGGGGYRYGLLFNNINSENLKKINGIDNEYSVVYISDNIVRSETCLISFFEMVAKKYSKHKNFDIIVPNWIIEDCIEYTGIWVLRQNCVYLKKLIIKLLSKYYSNIDIVTKDKIRKNIYKKEIKNDNSLLTIRGDIYPLKNEEMLALIKYSVKDILLTGDQSITDALSCCPDKNIFYQIATWKESFGKDLAKDLPNKFLMKKSTSCGSLDALKYNSNYKKFVDYWDFRKLAKPKMDAAMIYSKYRKDNLNIKNLEQLISSSKNLNSFKNKIV